MQPYLFPYLGYFQLAACVDRFVFFDDAAFMKKGYINRNSILSGDAAAGITFPVCNASQNRAIADHYFSKDFSKQLRSIEMAYAKAPFFEYVFPLVLAVLDAECRGVADVCRESILGVMKYLGRPINWCMSSDLQYARHASRVEKLAQICGVVGGDTYVNSIGGRLLYKYEDFLQYGLRLYFLKMHDVTYVQRKAGAPFVSNLSIIDVLMWCSPGQVVELLGEYQLFAGDDPRAGVEFR